MAQLSSKSITPQCPMCRNDFDVYYRMPRVVPKCGHTFCEKCISSHLAVRTSRKVFACPECQSEVIIRKGVQDDVPKNIGIIDIIKNLKKYSSNQKQQERKSTLDHCSLHHRPFQLVCQTCQFKQVCPNCVLYGEHKSHKYRKQAPPSSLNLKDVKQYYEIVTSSVKQILLPDSQKNIKNTIKDKISEGLKKSVRTNFKQYYELLQRKQSQIFKECDNLVLSEGGIDNNIEKLIIQYDSLKNKYQIDWSFAVQHNTLANSNKTSSNSQHFIAKCQELHSKVQSIEKQAFQYIEQILKKIGSKICQNIMFKIQQLPFSLKKIVENINSNQKQILSPDRKARLKSTNSEVKSRSVIEKDESKVPQYFKIIQKDEASRNQCKPVAVKKSKNTYSQVDRQESTPPDDFSILENGKPEIINFKQRTQNNKQLKQLISNKNIAGQRGSLPPKASKTKNISDYDSKTMHFRQLRQDDRSLLKDLSPAKTVNNFVKPSNSSVPVLAEQLKFVRPTKEISFQLLSKFQQIMVQTDRQLDLNTLQLVSLDINDALLLYLLDYLRMKKHRFQVIKLVKNSITDEGFRTILSYLISDTTTQLLNMTSNQLTLKSLELIILFAQKNTVLKTVYLGGNKINSTQLKSKRNQLSKYELQIII